MCEGRERGEKKEEEEEGMEDMKENKRVSLGRCEVEGAMKNK